MKTVTANLVEFTFRYYWFMVDQTSLIDSATHWLENALAVVDGDVVLTSPYLSFDVCRKVAAVATNSSHSWRLVTALDPSAVANGYLTVEGLRVLLEAGVEVVQVDRLHAKCFIVGSRAMLGSANLTGAGLGSSANPNFELGVELDSRHLQHALEVIATWPSRSVDSNDLDQLIADSPRLTRTPERAQDVGLDSSSALHLAEALLADARDPGRSLWLKVEYGEPGLQGWKEQSWFASPKKGRPGIRPGDLVFICANDTHDCYAVVEVISAPEFQPDDYADWLTADRRDALDRWPWINRTMPRLVPDQLMQLKREELGVRAGGLQNGHVRLSFDQFTAGVRSLSRLASS